MKLSIKIINLERRSDRKNKALQHFSEVAPSLVPEVVKGIDGTSLNPSASLNLMFGGNDFYNWRGVIGCALSHFNLWQRLLNESENESYLIFEDDVTLADKFQEYFNDLIKNFDLCSYPFLFLDYSVYPEFEHHKRSLLKQAIPEPKFEIGQMSELVRQTEYIGGFYGYLINKKGAQIMLDYIHLNGVRHGIDYLIKTNTDLPVYILNHSICGSTFWVPNNPVDTDIQTDVNSIPLVPCQRLYNLFVYLKGKDQIDHDVKHLPNHSLECLFEGAIVDEKVVAVNSLGFLKDKVEKLATTPFYNSHTDGLYVKKDYFYHSDLPKITIKIMGDWAPSRHILDEFKNMCDYSHGERAFYYNIEFVSEEKADYYLIINCPYPYLNEYYDPIKTIIVQGEPMGSNHNDPRGVKMWGVWTHPDPARFLKVITTRDDMNLVQWQYQIPQRVLRNNEFPKSKLLTAIVSSNYVDPGHIKRIDFLKFLETKDSPISNEIDIYGRSNEHHLKHYRRALADKAEGYIPYKYCIAAENNSEKNYITEKIWEPILTECLVFYWGAPNLETYIPSEAFIRLDLDDFENGYQTIVKAIENNEWERRLPAIKTAKELILNKYSLMERVLDIVLEASYA